MHSAYRSGEVERARTLQHKRLDPWCEAETAPYLRSCIVSVSLPVDVFSRHHAHPKKRNLAKLPALILLTHRSMYARVQPCAPCRRVALLGALTCEPIPASKAALSQIIRGFCPAVRCLGHLAVC